MNNIKNQYLNLPQKSPYLTILISLAFILFLGIGISYIKIDDNFVKMFPDNIPSKIVWDDIQEDFGSTEHLVVAFGNRGQSILEDSDAYSNLVDLVTQYENLDLVEQVISINNNFSDKGNKTLKSNFTNEQIDYFTNQTHSYISFYIVPKLDINNADLVSDVKRIAKNQLNSYDVHFAGQPYLTGEVPNLISKDIRSLMFIGVAVMVILLGLNLKSFYSVFIVFLTSLLSLVGTMGFMGWLYLITGYDIYNFTILGTSMPIILLTIANSDGVHIAARFRKEVRKLKDVSLALAATLKSLRKPIFLTSLTTAIAFLSMISSPIPHMIGYGIVIAFGVFLAWILSTTFLPSLIIIRKWNLNASKFKKDSFIESLVEKLSQKVIRNPKQVLFASILIVGLSSIGLWFVKVEVNVIKFFNEDTSIRESTNFVDKELFGSMSFTIQCEGDFSRLDNIVLLDSLQRRIEGKKIISEIKKSFSYADIVKESYQNFNIYMDWEDSSLYPEDNAHLSEVLLFSQDNNENAELRLSSIINSKKNKTLIMSQMETVSTERASEIAKTVNSEIARFKIDTGSEIEFKTTGLLIFLKDFVSMVVESSLISIVLSVFIIALVVRIFFGSFSYAFLSIIPLSTAIILNFGIMGLIGVELSHLTALLTSVIIGVGVDFSIHYLSDYKNKIKDRDSFKNSNLDTSKDVGYPIMLDVVSNLGFVALLFSSIIPLNFIGGLMIFAMLSTSFGTLTILSSVIELMKGRIKN
ncbi:MAG: hypothetical protein CMG13_06615 [Candidatus Marinimicrobia bacterium]|nr:hypothetical protein [Candidatus Neomarinimicrobiota bacterium]